MLIADPNNKEKRKIPFPMRVISSFFENPRDKKPSNSPVLVNQRNKIIPDNPQAKGKNSYKLAKDFQKI
jgi:hypothetical protein